MKIMLCCRVYPTQRPGGMPFVCQDRAKALVKLGHEVHVVTTGAVMDETPRNRVQNLDDDGVQVHHLDCLWGDYSPEYAEGCERAYKYLNPDVLHLDSFDVQNPWFVSYEDHRFSLTMHGFCWGAHFTRWNLWHRGSASAPTLDSSGIANESRIMKRAHAVIGVSRHEHWMLRELMGLGSKAKLIYNPIADYFFDDPPTRRSKLASTMRPRLLCAAVSGSVERGFDLAKRAAEQAKVELNVAKDVKRRDMPNLIDSYDALALPTVYSQGLDLAVGEAIIRRRPVIATNVGSYTREAEKGGIYEGAIKLIDLTDYEGLSRAMAEPLDWADWRAATPWVHKPEYHAEKWLEAVT